jgi:hypothetical protein
MYDASMAVTSSANPICAYAGFEVASAKVPWLILNEEVENGQV